MNLFHNKDYKLKSFIYAAEKGILIAKNISLFVSNSDKNNKKIVAQYYQYIPISKTDMKNNEFFQIENECKRTI